MFFLIFTVSVSLAATLSVWTSSAHYIASETVRTGCRDITAWVSGLPDFKPLAKEIFSLVEVKNAEAQDIIFTDYEANEIESDSEGQFIKYASDENKYKFFKSDLSGYLSENAYKKAAEPKEIYIVENAEHIDPYDRTDHISFDVQPAIANNTIVCNSGLYEQCTSGFAIKSKGILLLNLSAAIALSPTFNSSGGIK